VIPEAGAVRNDLGLPYIEPRTTVRLSVALNGVPMKNVAGYDIQEGYIYRYKTTLDGQLIQEDGHFVLEKVYGEVAVKER